MSSPTPSANTIGTEFSRWMTWTILFPVTFAFAVWGLSWLMGVQGSFIANFGTGDLLPIAAMLFLVVLQEIEKVPKSDRDSYILQWGDLFLMFSLLTWLGFTFLKIAMLKQGQESIDIAAKTIHEENLFLSSIISCGVLLIMAILGYMARLSVKRYELSNIPITT